ncbi:hypothetical protein ACJ41O_004041 [Fusarium nematophilum]
MEQNTVTQVEAIEPANILTGSSNASSYFTSAAASKTTSAETTPGSTPGLKAEETDNCDTCKIGTKPVPALLREFPKPQEDIDVKTMLGRHPGRWTIQGQMEANQRRTKPAASNEEELKAQRVRDFEKAKEDLRAFHGHLRTGSGQWRP